MKKILLLLMISLSTSIYAETEETLVYEGFTCTEEEVKEFIERENETKSTVPDFKNFKQAFKEVKVAEEAQTGSGPGGCLTIFDTYEFPKLPDEFFSFDPTDLTNIPALLAQAAMKALQDGYCTVTSTEFYEKQRDKFLERAAEKARLKEKGIRNLQEPWLPQVMNKELEYHLTEAGVKNPKDMADFLTEDDEKERQDAMDDYFGDIIEDGLEEHVDKPLENTLDDIF